MSNIKFYLQAEPNFKGQLRVLEYYEAQVPNSTKEGFGIVRGLVDADIKHEHEKNYAKFSEYVAKNDVKLFEKARGMLGVPVYIEESK